MKIYRLNESHQGSHRIIELDEERYLITHSAIHKVEHTVIIERPGISSRIVQEFRSNSESDNPLLEEMGFTYVDAGDEIYLFWYSDKSYARFFGHQYQVDEDGGLK